MKSEQVLKAIEDFLQWYRGKKNGRNNVSEREGSKSSLDRE